MGYCQDCKWCQTLEEQGFVFTKTTYHCTNLPVVQAKGQGRYSHDIRVRALDSCRLFEKRPSLSDIGFNKK